MNLIMGLATTIGLYSLTCGVSGYALFRQMSRALKCSFAEGCSQYTGVRSYLMAFSLLMQRKHLFCLQHEPPSENSVSLMQSQLPAFPLFTALAAASTD